MRHDPADVVLDRELRQLQARSNLFVGHSFGHQRHLPLNWHASFLHDAAIYASLLRSSRNKLPTLTLRETISL
jgi:hypothetical protein